MNIGIFLNLDNNKSLLCVDKLVHISKKLKNINIFLEIYFFNKYKDLNNLFFIKSTKEILKLSDILFVVGGDGTILKYSKIIYKHKKLILGINTGRVGFITSIKAKDIKPNFFDLINNYVLDSRMTICAKSEFYSVDFALNDIVLTRTLDSQIVDFEILKNNKKICEYRADGVIISTPTGSTAYSLSAGGPIIDLNLDCVVITPICANNSMSRSLVLSLTSIIEINYILRTNSKICILSDGQKILESEVSANIKIKKNVERINLIKILKNV
ncbi:MAG: NAD(+)/NADH kinase [Candidatus Paraimprobicoccus trichonymphae]|uniref:NAD kinase n=1 Tax=Candidatus Paraimprobicoccus trichonymphae TaxID=3033793 RepID=A0AA48I9N1_9FIRM|nr:MAG: NAD(+)/NADH kinase [Candidatus Paraimprobicoccus trichonymphae]